MSHRRAKHRGATLVLAGTLVLPNVTGTAHSRDAWLAETSEGLGRIRAQLSSGRLRDALLAAADLAGIRPEARALTPSAAPADVPPPVRAAVGRLLGAVAWSEERARGAVRATPGWLAQLAEQARRPSRGEGPPHLDPVATKAEAEKLRRLSALALAAVDRQALYEAALGLASGIDDTLPAIRAASRAMRVDPLIPATGPPIEGCDVADHPPVLCIGGLGPNLYRDDYALLLDLGGGPPKARSGCCGTTAATTATCSPRPPSPKPGLSTTGRMRPRPFR